MSATRRDASPLDTPLWDALESFTSGIEPGARLAPIAAGFTDSHWLRDAYGTVAYGFFPIKAMDVELAAGSSTRRTSASRSTTSSSASTCCARRRARRSRAGSSSSRR